MIRDPNDPTGMGLFSKYGRNHACKVSKNRPQTAKNTKKNKHHFQQANLLQGKQSNEKQKDKQQHKQNNFEKSIRRNHQTVSKSQFQKQQSREQRQVRYRKESTPAVGQYNPAKKDNPKMVWDILKIYKKKQNRQKFLQKSRLQAKSHKNIDQNGQKMSILHSGKTQQQIQQEIPKFVSKVLKSPKKVMLQQSYIQKREQQTNRNSKRPRSAVLSLNKKIRLDHKIRNETQTQHLGDQKQQQQSQLDFDHNNSQQKTGNKKNRYQARSKYKTQVDMSRMTGRVDFTLKTDYNNSINLSRNLQKSTEFVQIKKPRNIVFSKQLSRDQANRDFKTVSQEYSYDYTLVKPKSSWMCKFDKISGRKNQFSMSSGVYSYTHYQYDNYVWKNSSKVFPNTKLSLINFSKQSFRKA